MTLPANCAATAVFVSIFPRPHPTQCAAMSETPLAIGIDFGGTSVKTGVVCGHEIIDQAPPIATQEFESPGELMATMIRVVGDLRSRHGAIRAVGIGMPGFVDFEK